MTNERLTAAAITRRNAIALMTGAAASVSLGTGALAQGTPKRGGTLRVSAFTNPSSLDPCTGGAGSDHTFLYTMYDSLTEWDFETLKPKPGPRRKLEVHRSDHAGAEHPRGRDLPRRQQARCGSGEVQSRPRQDRPEVEHQGRRRDHGLGRGDRPHAGHHEAQLAGLGDACNPVRSRRHDGFADGDQGRRRRRPQSQPGWNRRVQLCELGGRRAHRHQAQRQVLETEPPLHGRDRVCAHSRADDRRPLRQRRAERPDLSVASAAKDHHGALAEPEGRHRADALCLPDLLQLGQTAVR